MFYVGGIGIFHINEQLAWQLTTGPAALKAFFIAGAIVHRAHLRRHHLLRPESGTLNIYTSRTGLIVEFAFIADQSAG